MPIVVDKEKKRKEIIEAAIAVFSQTGYHRTKIKDIADEAKVGKGTVYEYFRSKDDLFFQAGEYLFEQYILTQKNAMDTTADAEEQIRKLIASTFDQAAMLTGLTYLYVDMWSEMDRKGEEDKLRRLVADMLKRMTEDLSEYIREGQARGAFKDYDAVLTAHIIFGVLDGLMFQLLTDLNMFDLKAMSDTLADVLLNGLKK